MLSISCGWPTFRLRHGELYEVEGLRGCEGWLQSCAGYELMEEVSSRAEHYIDLMQIHLLDGPRPVQVGEKVQNKCGENGAGAHIRMFGS